MKDNSLFFERIIVYISNMRRKINYKSSGVDINKANRLVSWIKKSKPFSEDSLGSDYASLFSLPLNEYKEPVMASSTDGVGTKVKISSYFSDWKGLGQDLVAMCVNDLICVGAKPLFFLDYYACGKLDIQQSKSFFKGLYKACKEASCDLIGGETAELPGLYKKGDIDCAGFAVGIVEKKSIFGPHKVQEGDDVIALASSGFHSNGYSLLRNVYKSTRDLNKNKKLLLEPTRLYSFLQPYFHQISGLKSMAHITGGGLDNISRIIPKGLFLPVNPWSVPGPFLDVKKRSQMTWPALLKTLNCGLGFVLILRDKQEFFKQNIVPKEEVFFLGKVERSLKKSSCRWSLSWKAMDKKNNV